MKSRAAGGPAGRHLTPLEVVEVLESTASPDRVAHTATCDRCAADVEEMRELARLAASVDVPEPPAFFWNQFSARVRAAVAEEPRRQGFFGWRGWSRPAVALPAVLLVCIATFMALSLHRSVDVDVPSSSARATDTGVALQRHEGEPRAPDVFGDMENGEAWALVRSLAEDLDHDEMEGQGVSARPGAAEHLTLELSAAERIELARLLEEQMKERPRPGSAS